MAADTLGWGKRDELAFQLFANHAAKVFTLESPPRTMTPDVHAERDHREQVAVEQAYRLADVFLDTREFEGPGKPREKWMRVSGREVKLGDELFEYGNFHRVTGIGPFKPAGFNVEIEILDPDAKDLERRRYTKKIPTSYSHYHIIKRAMGI